MNSGLIITWDGCRGYTATDHILATKMRSQDVPLYVRRGNFDIGITGQDCVAERGLENELIEVCKLPVTRKGNKKVSIALFVIENSWIYMARQIIGWELRGATKYPNITKVYFDNIENRPDKPLLFDVCYGSTEIIVESGCVAWGADVVDSGATIKQSGLKIIDTIMVSSTVLVANREAYNDRNKKATIDWLKQLISE